MPFWSIGVVMGQVASKRIRLGALGAVLATALGGAIFARSAQIAESRWQEALDTIRILEARLDVQAVAVIRPALWGETTDERARPHYEQALSLVADWSVPTVTAAVCAEGEVGREVRAALVAKGAEALDALHQGAHAACGAMEVEWSSGFDLPRLKFGHARIIVQLCGMKAAILLDEGREMDAVGVLLDGLQFAGDLTRSPLIIEEMIGLSLLSPRFLLEGVADGSLLSLSADAGQRLASGMCALDRRLGWKVTSLQGELIASARWLETMLRDEDSSWTDVTADWASESLSVTQGRRLAAEHVAAMHGINADYDRAFADSLRVVLAMTDSYRERVYAQKNPVSAVALPHLDSAQRARFYSLGRYRLLTRAIAGADAPVDPWLDPFVRIEETDDGTWHRLDHDAFGGVKVAVARRHERMYRARAKSDG